MPNFSQLRPHFHQQPSQRRSKLSCEVSSPVYLSSRAQALAFVCMKMQNVMPSGVKAPPGQALCFLFAHPLSPGPSTVPCTQLESDASLLTAWRDHSTREPPAQPHRFQKPRSSAKSRKSFEALGLKSSNH